MFIETEKIYFLYNKEPDPLVLHVCFTFDSTNVTSAVKLYKKQIAASPKEKPKSINRTKRLVTRSTPYSIYFAY